MRTRMSVSFLLFTFALSTLAASRQPAFANNYREKCANNQSAWCVKYMQQLRAYEAELKKKHREEAAKKNQMQDELAWEKANKGKSAEPGATTQKCSLVKGQLICD